MRINVTSEQIEALRPYMPTLDAILAADDLGEFETELDGAILDHGMDENGDLNDIGLRLQKLYDVIYLQND